MSKLLPCDYNDPVALWAEIHRLRAELKGPDGFETWKDAAVSERLARVKATNELVQLASKMKNIRKLVTEIYVHQTYFGEPAGSLNGVIAELDAIFSELEQTGFTKNE